jgi:hypothetical protein
MRKGDQAMSHTGHSSARCSFCGRAVDAEELVWAPTGASICGHCVASYSRFDTTFTPWVTTDITEIPPDDASAVHRSQDLGALQEPGGVPCPLTHVHRSRSGRHAAAYGCATGRRIILWSDIPSLPPPWVTTKTSFGEHSPPRLVVPCHFCGISSDVAQATSMGSFSSAAICCECVEVALRMLVQDGLVPELNIEYRFKGEDGK